MVRAADGFLPGRIDRVEPLWSGTCLVKFQSTLQDDLRDSCERRPQIYAAPWHSARGEQPVEALIVYPQASTAHMISVDPARCQQAVNEARKPIAHFNDQASAASLAMLGNSSASGHNALQVRWQEAKALQFVPIKRFSRRTHLQQGKRMRVRDVPLSGHRWQPVARVDDHAEAFILHQQEQNG